MVKNYIEEAKKRLGSYGDSGDYVQEETISSEERLRAWRQAYRENAPRKEDKSFWWFVLMASLAGMLLWGFFNINMLDSALGNHGMNISKGTDESLPFYLQGNLEDRISEMMLAGALIGGGIAVLLTVSRMFIHRNDEDDEEEYY